VVDESITIAVRDYLANLRAQGLDVSFGVIFGSQARGTTHQWSDIDLLVVSPRFDSRRRRKDINLMWHIAASTDVRIEPIACGEQQWVHEGGSPIIEIARREGQIVRLA
jgi:uncharacterized protein